MPTQGNGMILGRSNMDKPLEPKAGHMTMSKRPLLMNRGNLNSVKKVEEGEEEEEGGVNIVKISIPKITLLTPRTSISTSISL